jgi:hypothetical protein
MLQLLMQSLNLVLDTLIIVFVTVHLVDLRLKLSPQLLTFTLQLFNDFVFMLLEVQLGLRLILV